MCRFLGVLEVVSRLDSSFVVLGGSQLFLEVFLLALLGFYTSRFFLVVLAPMERWFLLIWPYLVLTDISQMPLVSLSSRSGRDSKFSGVPAKKSRVVRLRMYAILVLG